MTLPQDQSSRQPGRGRDDRDRRSLPGAALRRGPRPPEPEGDRPPLCAWCGARLAFTTDGNGRMLERCLGGCDPLTRSDGPRD